MDTNQNPTVQDIRHHLIIDNGWMDIEVADLLEAYEDDVNEDGTTNATHDEWEYRAQHMPESN